MNEQELNRKLAKWAGFEEQKNTWHFEFTKKVFNWLFPDKHYIGRLPDFTVSLNACFKWLVPKLTYVDISSSGVGQYTGWVRSKTSRGCSIATAPTSALALCLAIIKLIEKDIEELIESQPN